MTVRPALCRILGRLDPACAGPKKDPGPLQSLDGASGRTIFIHLVNEDSETGRGRQRLRDRLREATVREILVATEEILVESGLEHATMAQIAERAGVAVGTLYNRFADRDALIEMLLSERRANVLEKLDDGLAALEAAGFREQLVGFFTVLFTHMDEHRPFLRLVFSKELGKDQGREEMGRAMFERLGAILKRGQRDKLVRRDADHTFALTLLSSAKGFMQRETYGLPALSPAAAARALVGLFLDGAGREER
jgi:AcrR family transcriptional regulator